VADERRLPVVAVVGRPNVGKSSLVNRILGRREAIVQESPGVTRDRRSFVAEWSGHSFEVFDTGGLEPGAAGIEARVGEQAAVAIDMADVVVLVVDATTGLIQDDLAVAERLRGSNKPVLVVVNKVDDPVDDPLASVFYRLGMGDPQPLSALHGRRSGDFLDALVDLLPSEPGEGSDEWASLAIVGRPNVGKSSILNAILREDRAIVDAEPGTTRDPVDSWLKLPDGQRVRVVDTAGMRRQVQIKDEIEYFGWLRSRRVLGRVDAAVLVVDVSEGVTGGDQRIAEEILSSGRACVVALNKWDLVTGDEADRTRLERDIKHALRFLPWAKVVRTSARTGRGVDRLLPALVEAVESHRRRLPTAAVNRIVLAAQERRPHPRSGGRNIRIRYAVQAAVSPPTVILFTNGPLENSYLRYLEHRIRAEEPFVGSPLRLEVRVRDRRKLKV
jgi:GTP-binding protein